MECSEKKVGTHFYLIVFIQSVPGFERQICNALKEKVVDESVHFYFSFSEFDIVAVIELGQNNDFDSLISFSHPKIRDFQQVICYSHGETDEGISFDSALTITLLKFTEHHTTNMGIDVEESSLEIVRPIIKKSRQNHIQGSLLGTLGWSEAIYFQTGENMEDLLDNVAEIAASGASFANLQISHTIPCVKIDLSVNSNEIKGEHIAGEIKDWRIVVSCYPYSVFEIESGIQRLYTVDQRTTPLNVTAIFGRRDLLIQPSESSQEVNSIEEVLRLLSTLRLNFSKYIISTHTALGIELPNMASASTSESLQIHRNEFEEKIDHEFENLKDKVNRFEKWEKERENITLKQTSQLYQVVSRLQAIAATPGLEGVVNDLLEFVKSLVRKARNQVKRIPPVLVSEYNRKRYLELEDMENVFLFGLEQRMAGARLGLGHPSQAYSNLQGLGIQRVLRASRSIPFGLLMSANIEVAQKWWGFTVFGFRNDTFTLTSGVINLPYHDMLHPEDWWRLGHESGHAFGMITDLLDNPLLRDSINRLDKNAVIEYVGRDYELIIDEMAVGVFEYVFCYRGNFDLYLRTTWRFLDNLLEGVHNLERLKEYILRTLFVFLFHLEYQKSIKSRETIDEIIQKGNMRETMFEGEMSHALKERAFKEEQSLEKIIEHSILDKIDKLDVATRITSLLHQVNLRDVASAYRAIEAFRSDLFHLFEAYQQRQEAEFKRDLKYYNLPDIENILASIASALEDGKIIVDLDSPADVFLIPLSLQYTKNEKGIGISQRARIAAILSLWHQDRIWHR